jgi:hypothetical protein
MRASLIILVTKELDILKTQRNRRNVPSLARKAITFLLQHKSEFKGQKPEEVFVLI